MSVPVWKRNLSKAEYIYQTYRMNIRLGEILANKPKKYQKNYSDELIKTALSALKHLQVADSIFLTKQSTEKECEIREENLLLAKAEIAHVATVAYIFLEIVRTHGDSSLILRPPGLLSEKPPLQGVSLSGGSMSPAGQVILKAL